MCPVAIQQKKLLSIYSIIKDYLNPAHKLGLVEDKRPLLKRKKPILISDLTLYLKFFGIYTIKYYVQFFIMHTTLHNFPIIWAKSNISITIEASAFPQYFKTMHLCPEKVYTKFLTAFWVKSLFSSSEESNVWRYRHVLYRGSVYLSLHIVQYLDDHWRYHK